MKKLHVQQRLRLRFEFNQASMLRVNSWPSHRTPAPGTNEFYYTRSSVSSHSHHSAWRSTAAGCLRMGQLSLDNPGKEKENPIYDPLITQWDTHSWILWWRHQMETYSASLTLCERNSPVTGEFPSQRPVTRSFGDFWTNGWANIDTPVVWDTIALIIA